MDPTAERGFSSERDFRDTFGMAIPTTATFLELSDRRLLQASDGSGFNIPELFAVPGDKDPPSGGFHHANLHSWCQLRDRSGGLACRLSNDRCRNHDVGGSSSAVTASSSAAVSSDVLATNG
jgi:hypothetical protein